MEIEVIGCTGAGKSSLAAGILAAGQGHSVEISLADEYVLKRCRLQWLKSRLTRTLVLDVMSVLTCVATWRNNREFLGFALGVVRNLPVGWFEKANLARNVVKKIGIHEMIRRYRTGKEVVVVDEGTLQSAHYLFVHVSVEPVAEDVASFAKLVPLPDVAVHVTQGERILVERTLRRGHARIREPSCETVERFVRRAVTTFDRVWQVAVLGERMAVVERGEGAVIGACHQDEAVGRAVKIIRAGIDGRYRSNAQGPSGFSTAALRRWVLGMWRWPRGEEPPGVSRP